MISAGHALRDHGDRGAGETAPRGGGVARAPRSLLVLSFFAVLAVLGIAGLTALGVWQLERRIWKLDLIEQVETRVHAAPAPMPGPAAWPQINASDDAYRRITVTGRFLHDRETLVQAVTDYGRGYWVLTPLRTADGSVVLVNRGFVPPEQRDPATRAAGQLGAETTVTGLLRITEPKGAFLRSNDPQAGLWYSRDVAAIAQARDLAAVAPFFIDVDAASNPAGTPRGGLTVISFNNNHLLYAVTWFALALMLAAATVFVAYDAWRSRQKSLHPGKPLHRPVSDHGIFR